jgi:hypothetical protein
MNRSSFSEYADQSVPAGSTGLLITEGIPLLATPLVALVATAEVAGAVAGAATAVGGLAVAGVAAAKGDEEEPAAPPLDIRGAAGGHVLSLLAHRGNALL